MFSLFSRSHAAALAVGLATTAAISPLTAGAEPSQVAGQCAGVDEEAKGAPFTSWPGVSQAKRVMRVEHIGKARMHRPAGVQLFVPAREGVSAVYLQRLAGCQIAMAAEQGGQHALSVPDIRAEVAPRGDGYRVRLITPSVAAANELARRMGL